MSRRLFYSETLQEAYVRVQILWCHINLGKRRHGWDKRCIVLCPRGVQNSSLSFVVSHKVFAQGKWFTKMLSVCKGQQRICGSRIRRSLERRSHCLEIQIFAAAQSQLCQLFYNRMFVCVNSSSESIIVSCLSRSQQKFLPRFHSAVLLSLSCRLVAGCCGKLFRKTPLARLTMHQPHFVFRLLLLPIFFSSALIRRRVFVSIRVILSNVMCRNFSAPEPVHIWWESYIWCQLERLKVVCFLYIKSTRDCVTLHCLTYRHVTKRAMPVRTRVREFFVRNTESSHRWWKVVNSFFVNLDIIFRSRLFVFRPFPTAFCLTIYYVSVLTYDVVSR